MTNYTRALLIDFNLSNPIYANTSVAVYTVNPVTFLATGNLATVYDGLTGTGLLPNPMELDNEGKWIIPPYVDVPVILRVTSPSLADHSTGIFQPPFASSADLTGAPPALSVTNTYTATGAISASDNIALINAAAAVSMTLGRGSVDGHPIVVKRYGAGAVTLIASIDGVAGSRVVMGSATVKESVSLAWSSALATWLLY